MAKGRYDRELEARWRRVLGKQAASKLSVREFCRREELSESSFYAWRRTIAQRDGHAKSKPLSPLKPKRHQPTNSDAPAFLPVVLDANDLQADARDIVIELRGERRLRLPESIEPMRLATLIHAIEAEPRA